MNENFQFELDRTNLTYANPSFILFNILYTILIVMQRVVLTRTGLLLKST